MPEHQPRDILERGREIVKCLVRAELYLTLCHFLGPGIDICRAVDGVPWGTKQRKRNGGGFRPLGKWFEE